MENLKCLVFALALLSQESFFCFCSLVGYQYGGVDNSSLYLLYTASIFLLTCYFILRSFKGFNKKVLLIPLALLCVYIVESISNDYEWARKSFLFFVLFCIPPILVGGQIGINDLSKLYKQLDLVIFLMGLGIIRALPRFFSYGYITLTGDSSEYNVISYYSALVIGFTYYNLLKKRDDRYSFLNNIIGRSASIIMILLLVVCIMLSGGRGGMVFLLVIVPLLSILLVNRKRLLRAIIIIIPCCLLLVVAVSKIVDDMGLEEFVGMGLDRAFSYISDDGSFDMSQSNREDEFSGAWKRILESPIIGRGLFTSIGKYGYPHNIFLEVWQGGGIFLLIYLLIILNNCLIRINKYLVVHDELIYLIPLFTYSIINLCFSGSYIMLGMFWFMVVVLYFSFSHFIKHQNIRFYESTSN